MHACMLMFFIYLCAEQTPRCVSLVSCVTMMKGTCCSQQKPLSTLRYRHPACIIHKSSGNSVTAHSLNFCDMGWRETQDSSVDPCPDVTFSRRENGAIMLMTSSSLCITFILPMRSENTFQTAWNVFHPVTQLLCFDAVQKLLHKTNSSASMQDSLCAVMFFFVVVRICWKMCRGASWFTLKIQCEQFWLFQRYFCLSSAHWGGALLKTNRDVVYLHAPIRIEQYFNQNQMAYVLNVNVYCQTSPLSRLARLTFWLRMLFFPSPT